MDKILLTLPYIKLGTRIKVDVTLYEEAEHGVEPVRIGQIKRTFTGKSDTPYTASIPMPTK